jgi:hypothetical protein
LPSFLWKSVKAGLYSLRPTDPLFNDQIDHVEQHQDSLVIVLKVHFERMHCVVASNAYDVQGLLDVRVQTLLNQDFYVGVDVFALASEMNQQLL